MIFHSGGENAARRAVPDAACAHCPRPTRCRWRLKGGLEHVDVHVGPLVRLVTTVERLRRAVVREIFRGGPPAARSRTWPEIARRRPAGRSRNAGPSNATGRRRADCVGGGGPAARHTQASWTECERYRDGVHKHTTPDAPSASIGRCLARLQPPRPSVALSATNQNSIDRLLLRCSAVARRAVSPFGVLSAAGDWPLVNVRCYPYFLPGMPPR